jgi:hypothetical protein
MPNLKANDVRVITEVNLWEISLVTFPANEAATISAVRADIELDALTSLLDALAAGTLDEARAGLVQQLVTAWDQRPGPAVGALGAFPHATPEQVIADRNRELAVQLALAHGRQILSGVRT